MTYEVEKEMVLKIGVMPVIEYLLEKYIWIDPDGDMDPLELLNYTAQIVQAKEVSERDIVQWLNPIKVLTLIPDEKDGCPFDPASVTSKVTLSINADDATFNAIGKIDDTSFDSGYISPDLDKISGFQTWFTEQGNGPTMIPVNSPMDNHVALLDTIGLGEPDVDLITEDDINPEVIGDLVGQYIGLYKGKPIDPIGPVYHRIQFMKDDMPQPLSTGAVLALAKEFTQLGFFTDVTTSPFTGVDNNVIHIGLMFTVIHSEHELIIQL